jgi:hypothetical protein
VDAPGNDGNASMPEQVKRPNPWRKMMMMMKEEVNKFTLPKVIRNDTTGEVITFKKLPFNHPNYFYNYKSL